MGAAAFGVVPPVRLMVQAKYQRLSSLFGFVRTCGSTCRSERGVVLMPLPEDINRLRRKRSVGAYLGLTTRRYQSSETDVVPGFAAGDAIARQLG